MTPDSGEVDTDKKICLMYRGKLLAQNDKTLIDYGFGKFGEDHVMFLYR